MFKQLKFNTKDYNVFFWSDLHFNHTPLSGDWLYKDRGFQTIEEHDKSIVERWNSKITDNDTVFLLGDLCFGKKAKDNLAYLLNTLNYKNLYICSGNHSAGLHQLYSDRQGIGYWDQDLKFDLFDNGNKIAFLIPNYFEIFVDGQAIVLGHYALASFNGQGKGSWNIFGHSHGRLKGSIVGQELLKGKSIDVGVEEFPYPPSFNEIKTIMSERVIVKTDQHDMNTQNPF